MYDCTTKNVFYTEHFSIKIISFNGKLIIMQEQSEAREFNKKSQMHTKITLFQRKNEIR